MSRGHRVSLCVIPAKEHIERSHAMALDQSALLEVLEALKAADGDDRVRQAAGTIYQALIEAELTAVIGAGPHERTETRVAQRNGHRPRTLTTTAGIWSCGSRSCGPGRSSRPCWNAGGGWIRRCSRWWWRPTCTACRPGRSTIWSRRS